MKIQNLYLTSLIFPLIGACSPPTNPTQVQINECPTQPEVVLHTKNVKSISFNNETTTESGIVSRNQSLGYTFDGQLGQKLSYTTNQNICIWIYTPDNQLLTSGNLPTTGKYTIQVSAPQGSTTFDLAMNLETITETPISSYSPISNAAISKPSSTSTPSASHKSVVTSQPTPPPRTKADDFVRNHYIALNQRQYNQTWKSLSPRFQNISPSFSEYQKWWNSVREIKIGNINLINQTRNTAIVDAELWYVMNNGRIVQDSNPRIYLVWSNNSNQWLFEKKSKP
jgi:hypothetical protein